MLKGILKKYKAKTNNIKLIKEDKYYSAKIRLSKQFIKILPSHIDQLKGRIINFVTIMTEQCKYFPVESFLDKFKTLKINDLSIVEQESNEKKRSNYNTNENTIYLKRVDQYSLFHELLHFASDKSTVDEFNVGFKYYIPGEGYIGSGINEGYTEILRERYFCIELKELGYLYEYQMTKILEKIIGQEIMEDVYFNGNVLTIIRELTNYCSFKEAKEFIVNMDIMVNLVSFEDEKSKQRRKELLDKNYSFLKSCLASKQKLGKVR